MCSYYDSTQPIYCNVKYTWFIIIHLISQVLPDCTNNISLVEPSLKFLMPILSSSPHILQNADLNLVLNCFSDTVINEVYNQNLQYNSISLQVITNNSAFVINTEPMYLKLQTTVYIIWPTDMPQCSLFMNSIAEWMNESKKILARPVFYAFIFWPEIISSSQEAIFTLQQFAHLFPMDSKIFVVICTQTDEQNDCEYTIYSLYGVNNQPFVSKTLLRENAFKAYAISHEGLNRFDFQGAPLRAIGTTDPLDEPIATYDNSTETFTAGLSWFCLKDMKDILNFTIIAVVGETETDQGEDGRPIGIGAMLLRGEGDFTILHTYPQVYISQYLSPLKMWGADRVFAFFRQPAAETVQNIYLAPFSTLLWISVVLFLIFLIILITFFSKIHGDNFLPHFWIFWVLGALCQRSISCKPSRSSLKIIILAVWAFTYMSFTVYSSAIISAVLARQDAVKDYRDLHRFSFKILSDPVAFHSYIFTDESTDIEKYRAQLERSFIGYTESVEAMMTTHATYMDTLDTYVTSAREIGYTDNDICSLVSWVPVGHIVLPSGFLAQKNSPLREFLNPTILSIKEHGLYDKVELNYYDAETIKCLGKSASHPHVKLSHVSFAFFALFLGISLGSCFLLMEFMYNNYTTDTSVTLFGYHVQRKFVMCREKMFSLFFSRAS